MSATNPATPLEKHLDLITAVVLGIVVVLFVTILGGVIAYFIDHSSSYHDLAEKVVEQNAKIEALYQNCSNEKTAPQGVQPTIIYVPVGQGQVQSATQ